MKSSSDSLLRSRLTRRTATVTISAPLASRARAVSWKDLYFPVPTIRRERKERPAIINESDMQVLYLKRGVGSSICATKEGSKGYGDTSSWDVVFLPVS